MVTENKNLTNVVRFSSPHMDREKIREQACIWLAKLDANGKHVDQEAFTRWLSEDPEHLEVLLEMADLWDQMALLSELSEVFPLENYAKHSGKSSWLKGVTVIAASVILTVVAGWGWLRLTDEQQRDEQLAQQSPAIYETVVGQQSTVTLADGSQVILNTNTVMEIVFTDHERRVYLRRGEGLFTVAKDQSRPFRVVAGQRVIEAVGTAFSVQHIQGDSVEVIVTEGKVNFLILPQSDEESAKKLAIEDVLRDSDVVPLQAGEFAAAQTAAPESIRTGVIQPEEMEVKLAWQHGMLLFQGDPLEQVLEEFGRYTTIKLEATEAVKDIKVEGFYRAGDVERFLVAIENNFQIDVQEISENHFVLTAR